MAWVWFVYPDGDSRLLNLELAEYGYAYVKSADGTQYSKYFTDAIFDISIKKLRIYGEIDKDYDYSTEAKEMSIKKLEKLMVLKKQLTHHVMGLLLHLSK